MEALAWTAAATGHHVHAAVLLGAAHRLRQATGVALTMVDEITTPAEGTPAPGAGVP